MYFNRFIIFISIIALSLILSSCRTKGILKNDDEIANTRFTGNHKSFRRKR